jgi:hypothetical protein
MAVRVEQTPAGTFVGWDDVETPSTTFELVPERGVVEGEVTVVGDIVAYGATFSVKAVATPAPGAAAPPE